MITSNIEGMQGERDRLRFFSGGKYDLTVTVEYFRGSDNGAADAISRNQLDMLTTPNVSTGPSKADPSKSEHGGEIGIGCAMDWNNWLLVTLYIHPYHLQQKGFTSQGREDI